MFSKAIIRFTTHVSHKTKIRTRVSCGIIFFSPIFISTKSNSIYLDLKFLRTLLKPVSNFILAKSAAYIYIFNRHSNPIIGLRWWTEETAAHFAILRDTCYFPSVMFSISVAYVACAINGHLKSLAHECRVKQTLCGIVLFLSGRWLSSAARLYHLVTYFKKK